MADRKQKTYFGDFKSRFVPAIEQDLEGTPVNVLVLGPKIDGARLESAARLRKAILNRSSELGVRVLVVAAEHRQLIRAAKKVYGTGYNLCLYERKLARQCDLIVILPASAGSLVELGLFALERWACLKSAIFFDVEHKKSRSFISEGPRRAYRNKGARICDVNYNDVPKVLLKLKQIVQEFRAIKIEGKRFP